VLSATEHDMVSEVGFEPAPPFKQKQVSQPEKNKFYPNKYTHAPDQAELSFASQRSPSM